MPISWRKQVGEQSVDIPLGPIVLKGNLTIPTAVDDAVQGVVIFAHGSGSSRHSPRNRRVSQELVEGGFATLLIDLLTSHEEHIDRHSSALRFDIDLLADRLLGATSWVSSQEHLHGLPICYFGASTGAAAALVAAAHLRTRIAAVVSRGGRPDLAKTALSQVRAPTLFIVGGDDVQVLQLNRQAMTKLTCVKELAIIEGATHLFEEPGALESVAHIALEWFSERCPRQMGYRTATELHEVR